MATRSYEIDDTLQDCVDSAIEEVKQELLDHLKENPDTDELPDIGNDLDYSGRIHEIVDVSVPIYTQEIKDIMYLHGDDVEQAFDDAGIGSKDDKWPAGWQAAAIYCYIEQKVHEWYRSSAQDIFDEWLEAKPKAAEEEGGEEEAGGGEKPPEESHPVLRPARHPCLQRLPPRRFARRPTAP